MNNRDAIQLLDKLLLRSDFTDQYGDMEDSSPYEEAVEIAKEAIEKQIPTTPDDFDDCTANCPVCGHEFEIGYEQYSYCPDCGQALDWSSENE